MAAWVVAFGYPHVPSWMFFGLWRIPNRDPSPVLSVALGSSTHELERRNWAVLKWTIFLQRPVTAAALLIEGTTTQHLFLQGHLMRLSRLLILSAFGGLASFSLLQIAASHLPSSFIADTVDSLGMLYGAMIFGAGLFAILAAFMNDLWNSPGSRILRTRWIVFLPALIGLVGVLHGYLSMASYYAALPEDIVVPHNTAWATVTVGSLFTIAGTAIMFTGRHANQNSSSLTNALFSEEAEQ